MTVPKEATILPSEKLLSLASNNESIGNRWFWQVVNRDDSGLDQIATQPSVFDDPVTLEVYRPPSQYENAHKFDPNARWTWREELVSDIASSQRR